MYNAAQAIATSPALQVPQDDVQWYAVMTRPRHEKRVAEELAKSSVTAFLPLCHLFPGDSADEDSDGVASMRFYPDVPRDERPRRSARFIKRTMDVVGSLFALLVLSPVFVAIAILVKLTSNGPVFFRQQRIG